jgi:hypothetical protein
MQERISLDAAIEMDEKELRGKLSKIFERLINNSYKVGHLKIALDNRDINLETEKNIYQLKYSKFREILALNRESKLLKKDECIKESVILDKNNKPLIYYERKQNDSETDVFKDNTPAVVRSQIMINNMEKEIFDKVALKK